MKHLLALLAIIFASLSAHGQCSTTPKCGYTTVGGSSGFFGANQQIGTTTCTISSNVTVTDGQIYSSGGGGVNCIIGIWKNDGGSGEPGTLVCTSNAGTGACGGSAQWRTITFTGCTLTSGTYILGYASSSTPTVYNDTTGSLKWAAQAITYPTLVNFSSPALGSSGQQFSLCLDLTSSLNDTQIGAFAVGP